MTFNNQKVHRWKETPHGAVLTEPKYYEASKGLKTLRVDTTMESTSLAVFIEHSAHGDTHILIPYDVLLDAIAKRMAMSG